ncbi:type II toxin-antitoxin system VapB family antitoxin [uncultured Sphingomonas sp.]|uniref:type II toxin-antitoxin system VapB family antitoxin n=1 Tax=uncultured Sphingomonas sp. TaxID=158754 RepID=UPI0035CC7A0B
MASLYIKKPETADLAREVAELLGTSKTEAVHDALLRRKLELSGRSRADELRAKLDAWRAANPLPPLTGRVSDKAFFDEMWGEDRD